MQRLSQALCMPMTLAVILVVCGRATDAQEKKFAGAQFAYDQPATFGAAQAPLTSATQKLLPPLQVKVLMAGDGPVSPDLQKYLTGKSGGWGGPSAKQYVLEKTDRESVSAVLSANAVHHVEIVRPPRGIDFLSTVPFNRDAKLTHHVPNFVATYHRGNGETITAAVFDGGAIRGSHQEFLVGPDDQGNFHSRVTSRTTASQAEHASHVAGTIGAKGVRTEAEGMATAVSLLSYDWVDDLDNVEGVANEAQVTNHSYGPSTGWDFRRGVGWIWWGDLSLSRVEDANFGKYVSDNHVLDDILVRHRNVLVVVAAGNDRSDGPSTQPVLHYVRGRNPSTGEPEWQRSSLRHNKDGAKQGGVDTIAGLGLSKNVLCVGAINDIVQQGIPLPNPVIEPTYFTSWGPADDGRIKPDVVANGDKLFSTSSADDDVYIEMSGTSMASPATSGIACLLTEFFAVKVGRPAEAIEIKALLIHTANDAGTEGPDPAFGWGWIDALRAGQVIDGRNGAVMRLEEVQQGETVEFQMKQNAASDDVRATVVWADPPAPPNTGGLNDPTRTLQNDLDLTLIAPDKSTHYPYRLVRTDPLAPALTDGPNQVDNVEVVDAPRSAGTWTIRVTAAKTLVGETQSFALIVTGLEELN